MDVVVNTDDESSFYGVLLRCERLNCTHNKIPINATANSRRCKFENDVCGFISDQWQAAPAHAVA